MHATSAPLLEHLHHPNLILCVLCNKIFTSRHIKQHPAIARLKGMLAQNDAVLRVPLNCDLDKRPEKAEPGRSGCSGPMLAGAMAPEMELLTLSHFEPV